MMVPGDPVPHLVVPQARRALGAPETVLDPMPAFATRANSFRGTSGPAFER